MQETAWNNSQAQPDRVSKAHGSSSLRKFLILLYKGFLFRKRHYIVTFFEIVIPVFIASVPVIIESESSQYKIEHNRIDDRSTGSRWSNMTTYEPFDPLKVEEGSFKTLEFLYTPPDEFTGKFINDSIDLFQRSTNHQGEITSRGMESEKHMESYTLYKKGRLSFIGTVFHGFDKKKLPAYLDYKIRYAEKKMFLDSHSFETQRKYRMNGPHDKNDYTETFFLTWQTSVEETFIQRKMEEHNKQFDYKVWMQQFPYPEHKEGSAQFNAMTIVSWVICYGHLIFVINIVKRVVEEKANGSKELLKMMGMTNCTYWTSTFVNFFMIAFINALVIAILYKSPMKNALVFFKHTNFLILFIFLLLFLTSLILLCMTCSIFFNRPIFAILTMLVIYVISFSTLMSQYFFLNTEDKYFALSVGNKLGICLLPTGALLTAFQITSMYEASAEGVHWNNIAEFSLIPDMSMSMTLAMMLVSCVLFAIAIWYFDAVWPWQPGVPKPFYFLFTKNYWCGDKAANSEDGIQMMGGDSSSDFFEAEPSGIYPGVVIKNLSKDFRSGLTSKLAVNNVSLKIYQGQITALLGHNGAGKTTTINILTGLFTPTSGTASINGFDILRETANARGGFGVCPQHNVLYDTLTVEEHMRIYAAMKGVWWSQLTNEATQVLDIIKLTDKRHELVKNLSGGMKRKLSLGIAIVGGSKVLFLDEPTSGMDVEARRGVWDALLEIRRERTVILTTHYMEEADILGDRIAILADGEIQCCGSPMFLKQKFGTGYHLHVVKDQNFNMQGLTSLLKKYVPEVTVENELEKDISFRMSSTTGNEFGDMFEELEHHKNKLGVISFGITITTMEDVFLNVSNISDVKSKLQSGMPNQNMDEQLEDVYGDSARVKPHPRLANQFMALLIKRFHYAKRHWGIMIAQLVSPFLIMCLCFASLQSAQFKSVLDPLKLDISSVYGKTDGFYYQEKPDLSSYADTFQKVLESNQVKVEEVSEPTQYALDYGRKNLAKYLKTFLVGGAIDKDLNGTVTLTAWFNGEPYHAMPMSLLLMHTAILKSISSDGGISLVNAPLPQPMSGSENLSERIQAFARIFAALFVPLAFSSLSAGFVLVPVHERATKAKLLQLMSGVPAEIYWIAMFVWDFMVYSIICILMIIPYGIFAHHAFFGERSEAIGAALLLMLFHGWASIPFSYLLSFLFERGNTGFATVVGMSVFIGTSFGSTMSSIKAAFPDNGFVIFLVWVFRFLPPFSLSSGFANLFAIVYPNAFCESIPKEDIEFHCDPSNLDRDNPLFKCCKKYCGENCLKPTYPIIWEDAGCGREIFALAFSGIIFFSILFLKETPYWTAFFRAARFSLQRMKKGVVKQFLRQESVVEDSEVLQEEERIRNMTATRSGSGEEALLVSELTKQFKNFYAVNKLSFGIRQEECFGLLGVNGAGKTTTFRMLTGDCEPTSGNAFIQNSSLLTDLKTFQLYLGYCPQFDALIDRLTGREMLMLFGQLRGLIGFGLLQMVDKLIKMTDLAKHADKQTQFYSGGNKRKLSVAIALIGSPPLILLDEPTAGVDPVSRRKIWSILSQARNNTGAAVLLTTHSMEESEALCNRLAIMVNGRFRCLGSIQQLKSKYGQGYTLIIKVKREDKENIQKVDAIKFHIQSNLQGANLKDDHQGMLQYHIVNPSITLSYLFKFMSEMKIQFELEDYLISDTSLEQIFLTFARAQRISS